MAALYGIFLAGAFVLVFGAGFLIGVKATTKQLLAQWGFTKESAVLYKRAAKLLNRLANLTEFDGDLAADILSPASKQLVDEWLGDFRKQIERV